MNTIVRASLAVSFGCILLIAGGCSQREEQELPKMRPLTDRVFERTPKRLDRGKYLAEGVSQCFVCHSERDWSKPGAPPIPETKGGGRIISEDSLHRTVAPNISPDRETGAGTWTDDMFARAIREGIGHDGRALAGPMWYWAFANLSDEDLASIVVYLRSIPPVRNALPKRRLTPEEEKGSLGGPKPVTEPVAGRVMTNAVERGRYLADVADCAGCHTAWEAPLNPGLFGGGNQLEKKGKRLDHDLFSANLTSDPSGIAYYDDSLFVETIRTGAVRARRLDGVMPWTAFRNMNDDDLRSLFAYLMSQRPVRHVNDNAGAPSACITCGQQHGEGEYNISKFETFEHLLIDSTILDQFAGKYEGEFSFAIRREADHLLAVDGDLRAELRAGADTLFYAREFPGPVSFRRDASGRVVEAASHEDREIVLKKTE